jgi:hypothetical protein
MKIQHGKCGAGAPAREKPRWDEEISREEIA